MKIELANKIIDKAKTKKDGIYSLSGFTYVVKDGRFVFYADYFGNVFQRAGNFDVSIGKVERYNVRKKLNELL